MQKPSGTAAGRNRQQGMLALVFLAPALIVFTLFVVIPVIKAGYYSFFNWNGMGRATKFIGLKNFTMMFAQPVFRTALSNNLKVILLSLFVQLPLAFFLALLIGRRKVPGEVIFRSIYFFPYLLAEIVVGIIWKFIYHPQSGILTIISKAFGGGEIGLLGDPENAFIGILVVIVWKYLGLHMILYIAGLQGVSRELEDAAVVDGANSAQVIWHVVIPEIRNAIGISVFLSVIGSLNVFDVVWALGQGGPVHSTETLVTYLYNFGFRRFAFGYGSAVAVVIFLLCLAFNLLYQRFIIRGGNNA